MQTKSMRWRHHCETLSRDGQKPLGRPEQSLEFASTQSNRGSTQPNIHLRCWNKIKGAVSYTKEVVHHFHVKPGKTLHFPLSQAPEKSVCFELL